MSRAALVLDLYALLLGGAGLPRAAGPVAVMLRVRIAELCMGVRP